MLQSGEFDQRVTLQQRASGLDAHGQQSETWQNIATTPTVWAKAEPLRGRELFAASAAQILVDVRFTIRYRADVEASAGWRVVWNGVPHEIVGRPVNVRGRFEELELMTVSGIRGGA